MSWIIGPDRGDHGTEAEQSQNEHAAHDMTSSMGGAPPILKTVGRATYRVFGQQSRGPCSTLPSFNGSVNPRPQRAGSRRQSGGPSLSSLILRPGLELRTPR